jgi:hypothetical protein
MLGETGPPAQSTARAPYGSDVSVALLLSASKSAAAPAASIQAAACDLTTLSAQLVVVIVVVAAAAAAAVVIAAVVVREARLVGSAGRSPPTPADTVTAPCSRAGRQQLRRFTRLRVEVEGARGVRRSVRTAPDLEPRSAAAAAWSSQLKHAILTNDEARL